MKLATLKFCANNYLLLKLTHNSHFNNEYFGGTMEYLFSCDLQPSKIYIQFKLWNINNPYFLYNNIYSRATWVKDLSNHLQTSLKHNLQVWLNPEEKRAPVKTYQVQCSWESVLCPFDLNGTAKLMGIKCRASMCITPDSVRNQ